jgi:hypothetical protein
MAAPRAALEHVYDAAHDPPIVLPLRSRQVYEKVRDACPLRVAQRGYPCAHDNSPVPKSLDTRESASLFRFRP